MRQKLKIAFWVVKNVKNWLTYFMDYLGFLKNKQLIYYLRNGVKYKVRGGTCDRGIIQEIWFWKIYTPPLFEIKPDDIVIDIGAQIGIFSIFASKLAPYGKVYSFEPVPENFKLLCENIRLNNCQNIFCFQKAISDKEGEEIIFLNPHNVGGHSLLVDFCGEKLSISTVTLENVIKKEKIEKIDFLKIDCEGMEYRILLSSKNCLRKISKIALEYHEDIDKNSNPENLKKFLEEEGFLVEISSINNMPLLYALNKSLN